MLSGGKQGGGEGVAAGKRAECGEGGGGLQKDIKGKGSGVGWGGGGETAPACLLVRPPCW